MAGRGADGSVPMVARHEADETQRTPAVRLNDDAARWQLAILALAGDADA
jgi:hypothetical protein